MTVEDMSQWRKVLRACEEEDAKEELPALEIEDWEALAGELTSALHNMLVMFSRVADWEKFPTDPDRAKVWLGKIKEADEALQMGVSAVGEDQFQDEEGVD